MECLRGQRSVGCLASHVFCKRGAPKSNGIKRRSSRLRLYSVPVEHAAAHAQARPVGAPLMPLVWRTQFSSEARTPCSRAVRMGITLACCRNAGRSRDAPVSLVPRWCASQPPAHWLCALCAHARQAAGTSRPWQGQWRQSDKACLQHMRCASAAIARPCRASRARTHAPPPYRARNLRAQPCPGSDPSHTVALQ